VEKRNGTKPHVVNFSIVTLIFDAWNKLMATKTKGTQ